MNDWIIGLSTMAFIIGGAFAYAAFVIKFASLGKTAKPEKPRKADYMAIAKQQAEKATLRQYRERDAMDIWVWVEIAIRHLMKLWPGLPYDQARSEMKDYLDEAIKAWPSKDWDYTADSPREMAEEYAREYGETYGANA